MPNRIVLADDSETIRKVVQLVLEPEGFVVNAYRDGEKALEAIALEPPVLVFADVELPKISGILLCTSIKHDDSTSHIPVILLAGAFESIDEEAVRLSGADDLLVKPFESRELVQKVKALLGSGQKKKDAGEKLESTNNEESWLDESQSAQSDGAEKEPFFSAETQNEHAQPGLSADEELAKQWESTMKEAVSLQDNVVIADTELQNDELARQWAAMAVSDPAAPSGISQEHAMSFSEMLTKELADNAIDIEYTPAPISKGMDMDKDEIRLMVRSAVDEALAELLQSERSRIQAEIENNVRKAVREIAEAILKRELERTVPLA